MANTPQEHPQLHGELVRLRPVADRDVEPLLGMWSRSASIRERWTTFPRAELEGQVAGTEDEVGFAIELAGRLVGFVQYAEELHPEYRHASIDVFLTDDAQGRGAGTDAVRTLARYLVHGRAHHRITIDPAADNVAAIRCYEKVGFRRVGIMREYERGPDGTFHDGVLMDLLARELT